VPHRVLLTQASARDLEEIVQDIERHDSPTRADHVLERLESALASLDEHPDRGAIPDELLSVGLADFREIFFKPYRIVYRVLGDDVVVMLIADGRRNMQELLRRRLLTP
jgi:toxin ParE1/3/4